MTFEFEGHVAVVTGAAGGIGKALAHRFARAGMNLVLSDVDAEQMATTADELSALGVKVRWTRTDVADAASVEVLAALAFGEFGSVDLLCNNAGVSPGGRHRLAWEFPVEDWQWAFNVNVLGVVNGLRAFVPRMLDQGTRSHIVNTASIAGLLGGGRSPVYSASKHAVVHLTEALLTGLQSIDAPIGVTLLCPGQVRTEIYASERNRPTDLVPSEGAMHELPELRGDAPAVLARSQEVDEVADQAFAAINEGRFYVLTTDKLDGDIADRFDAIQTRRNPAFRGK